MKVRLNVMKINKFTDFCYVRGGVNQDVKDVYFVRQLGYGNRMAEEIDHNERNILEQENGRMFYLRINQLPLLSEKNDINFYSQSYDLIKNGSCVNNIIRTKDAEAMFKNYGENAFQELLKLHSNVIGKRNNLSIEKNFITKMLYWLDKVLQMKAIGKLGNNNKMVFENVQKKHEYLFAYFLCLLGCDVCLLQINSDIDEEMNNYQLSQGYSIGNYKEVVLKKFDPIISPQISEENKIPRHSANHKLHQDINEKIKKEEKEELTFEEIAKLASSVVMIAVHDNNGEIIGTGSGIMVGKKGYILTNCHVIAGGCFFSIRIEEDETTYSTNEVIKYNYILDLALIRVDRMLEPLKIYNSKDNLVRGQKVVAIGSPLGLFNSVSNGIISGFRNITEKNMLQFTAPISSGSSGGAVLNMFGEVIGISTSGMDIGQNINLAVTYFDILPFVKGFV